MMEIKRKNGTALPEGGVLEAPRRTLFQENWSLFRKNRLAMAGLVIILLGLPAYFYWHGKSKR